MKVAVVGAGIMGAATAWHAARAAAPTSSSTSSSSRTTRAARATAARGSSASRIPSPSGCASPPRRATAGRSSSESGTRLLELHGLVEIASRPEHTSARRARRRKGSSTGSSRRTRLRRSASTLPDGWVALYEPSGGIGLADDARHAFLDGHRRRVRLARRTISTRSTRTSSSSPRARGSAASSPTCR